MSRPLPERLKALQQAVELSRGRSSDDVVDRAAAAVKRADQRVAFSGNHTVVALAGATGSGKSTSFNAISGTEFAPTGVRRPTTSKPLAVRTSAIALLRLPEAHTTCTGRSRSISLIRAVS